MNAKILELPLNGLTIPEKNIDIPAGVIVDVCEQTRMTREQLEAVLPFNLGRGVPLPENINTLLEFIARTAYMLHYPQGHPAYGSGKKGVENDKNAFRGDAGFLEHIQKDLQEKWGLKVDTDQLIGGTAGGHDLSTDILGYLTRIRERGPIFTRLSYDRAISDVARELQRELQYDPKELTCIEADKKGLDLYNLEKEFQTNNPGKGSVLYLVNPGNNPDGLTIPEENLLKACQFAQEHNGVIEMDAAYLDLYFNESKKYELSKFQKYIDNGVLIVVRTATKEGLKRGPAYAVGNSNFMDEMLEYRSDKKLSPDYEAQMRWRLAEDFTHDDFTPQLRGAVEHLLACSSNTPEATRLLTQLLTQGVLTAEDFRKDVIRPNLRASFEMIRGVFAEAEIELSNDKVDHGYNVACKLLDHLAQSDMDAFLEDLKKYGIIANDLSKFTVGVKSVSGFRIPFGSFSPEHCRVIALLIKHCFAKFFG